MKQEKSKRAIAMQKLRQDRKSKGLVEFRAWVKPATKKKLEALLTKCKGT